jgi:hypothetical protein
MIVQAPDGSTVDFPDNTPNDVVNGAMTKHYASQTNQNKDAVFNNSFLHGAWQPMDAAAQILAHKFPETSSAMDTNPIVKTLGLDNNSPNKIDAIINKRDAEYNPTQSTNVDWPAVAGNAVGTFPLAVAFGKNPQNLISSAMAGATQGSIFGALQPVTNYEGNFWDKKKEQMASGSLTGGILSPAANIVGKVISPAVDAGKKMLVDAGINPTIGQLASNFSNSGAAKFLGKLPQTLEDMATSIPVLGDVIKGSRQKSFDEFNRAIYNKALEPIGEKSMADIGNASISELSDKLGARYDEILPKLKFQSDNDFASKMKGIVSKAQIDLPPEQFNQFSNKINSEVFHKMENDGSINGEKLKDIFSELNNKARNYQSSASANERSLGESLDNVSSLLRENIRKINPEHTKELSAIDNGYAHYSIIRDAAARLGSKEGVFTPKTLLSSIRAKDTSVGKGNFSKGVGLMQDLSVNADKILGGNYPDSGTAGRSALMQGATGLLAAGGTASGFDMTLPLAIGTAMTPYTSAGRKIATAIMTKRPDMASAVANAIQQGVPFANSALVPTTVGKSK